MADTESTEQFIKRMNDRARKGVYDQTDALPKLKKRAADGDLEAKSLVAMHEDLELRRTLADSTARIEKRDRLGRVLRTVPNQ